MPLRKGISELIGGAFEWLFCPVGKEGKNLNKPIFKSSNPGGGGDGAGVGESHVKRAVMLLVSVTGISNGFGYHSGCLG